MSQTKSLLTPRFLPSDGLKCHQPKSTFAPLSCIRQIWDHRMERNEYSPHPGSTSQSFSGFPKLWVGLQPWRQGRERGVQGGNVSCALQTGTSGAERLSGGLLCHCLLGNRHLHVFCLPNLSKKQKTSWPRRIIYPVFRVRVAIPYPLTLRMGICLSVHFWS